MSFLDDKVFVQREKKGRERGMEGWRDGGREREIGREREEGMKERKTERQGMRERKRILDEGQTQRDREGYCECV